jgi:RNA polymerase sigma factor (sigma-70 family)
MESEVTIQRRARFHQNADKYTRKLSARVYRWTHDVERTQESVQKVLLKYLEEMEAEGWVKTINNELAYLTRMAKNLLIDEGRVKINWISFDEEFGDGVMQVVVELMDGFDVEKQIYFDELLEILPLKTILGKLKPEKRELVQLYYLEDFSVEEIAEKLNKDPILIRYQINAIEATIRARFKKIYGKRGLFKSDT